MRSITYCYVFHKQTAKLGPESVLMPFISCKGNHKPGAFPQSPATSSPKEFLPQNWDASSSGAFKRIHRVVGQSEAHRWQPTQSLGHIFIASFISSKAYLKAYFNISYFKHLLKFFFSVTCAGRAVPMQMSCYPTWFRPAEVPSGALGWERRRKKVTSPAMPLWEKGAEVINPLLWIFWASVSTFMGNEHHQPPNEWFKK